MCGKTGGRIALLRRSGRLAQPFIDLAPLCLRPQPPCGAGKAQKTETDEQQRGRRGRRCGACQTSEKAESRNNHEHFFHFKLLSVFMVGLTG